MDFAKLSPPSKPAGWLDLDALDHNIEQVNAKTQAVKLRLATKSIRSIDVLNYIIAKSPNFVGLMSYAADESVYLLQQGFNNILCAYPSLDTQSIAQTFEYCKQGATMIWMVDRIEHVDVLNKVASEHNVVVDVCLDINMSMPLPKLYFGTKRSALMSKKQVKQLLKHIKSCHNIKITALMGYEAQIAGLPESLPGKGVLAPAIRLLKKRSQKQVSQRRGQIVRWLTKQGVELSLVNGGGSGSMQFTTSQPEVTEITVGSAYYKPAYFDYMDSMTSFKPAAGFVLPVTRQPENNVITCQSGGFIASGATGIDKAPVVCYPQGLCMLKDEGFGEVQTPFEVQPKDDKTVTDIKIGAGVWCRHAKAGELCEHFNALFCYRDNTLLTVDGTTKTMMTYRGEGKCFH